MQEPIFGIHHVTAIAGEPQSNFEFYSQLLGLRLVKLTVNYDDPGSYHFYYGDGKGTPGTLLTFFSRPGAPRGRAGAGQITVTSFSIPAAAVDFWGARLRAAAVLFETGSRFGAPVISFADPDGLRLELVGAADARLGFTGGPVRPERAIRGLCGVTLSEQGYESTAALLTGTMGFRHAADSGNRFRFAAGTGGAGSAVDVLCQPDLPPGRIAVGTVHHVAWRVPDDAAQERSRDTLVRSGLNVTPVIDRKYFHSIYFREPGGVLFEIATDPPGFAVDEPEAALGSRLMLPPWLEPKRALVEARLPALRLRPAA